MARYRTTIESSSRSEEAFRLLADFSTARHWDPSVVSGRRLDDGPLGTGSRFEIVVRFLGRTVPLDYELVHHDPAHQLVLRAENAYVVSMDTIRFFDSEQGCTITYDARLRPRGIVRMAAPLLGLAFARTGRNARAGLERFLVGCAERPA